MSPPGKYISSTSIPTPEPKSFTSWLPWNTTGRPCTTRVPSTAPGMDAMPPTTAIDTMRSESSGAKLRLLEDRAQPE